MEKQSSSLNVVISPYYSIVLVSSVIFSLACLHFEGQGVFGIPAVEKPFRTFAEFYPFYLSQHANATCRRLHVIGTGIGIFRAVFDIYMLLAIVPALFFAQGFFFLSRSLSHGFFEMGLMLGIYVCTMRILYGNWKKTLQSASFLLIGYGFAWVGHFGFEHNMPATFIYPVYSFFGDMTLLFEVATKSIAF